MPVRVANQTSNVLMKTRSALFGSTATALVVPVLRIVAAACRAPLPHFLSEPAGTAHEAPARAAVVRGPHAELAAVVLPHPLSLFARDRLHLRVDDARVARRDRHVDAAELIAGR